MNKGVVFAIIAAFMFSIMNAFVKAVSVSIGTGEIVFARSVIGLVIILSIMYVGKIKFSHKDIPVLIFRGATGGISMCLIFWAISGMPLGDVSILQQLSAFFVLIISVVYLKDKVPKKSILPLCLIVLGTCCVVKPWEFSSFSFYAIIAVIAAFLGAVAYTTIHTLYQRGNHNSWEIVAYFLMCSTVIGAVTMFNNYTPVNTAHEWWLLIGIGITSVLAQLFMTKAYGLTHQIVVSFILYLGVFLNALWGYIFFGEIMSVLSVSGGILIIGSSIALSLVKSKDLKRKTGVRENQQAEEPAKN